MAQDYYPKDMDESDDSESTSESPETGEESETALLPKSFFSGGEPKVGKICKVKVVRLYEDQAEVQYVKDAAHEEPDVDDMSKEGAANRLGMMSEMGSEEE